MAGRELSEGAVQKDNSRVSGASTFRPALKDFQKLLPAAAAGEGPWRWLIRWRGEANPPPTPIFMEMKPGSFVGPDGPAAALTVALVTKMSPEDAARALAGSCGYCIGCDRSGPTSTPVSLLISSLSGLRGGFSLCRLVYFIRIIVFAR